MKKNPTITIDVVAAVAIHDYERQRAFAEGQLDVIRKIQKWREDPQHHRMLLTLHALLDDAEQEANEALLPPLLRNPQAKVHK